MKFFDWLRPRDTDEPPPSGLSRRDFFAKVAGREGGENPAASREAGESPQVGDCGVLHTFHVARFPYHDGPVLVPMLRPGMEFSLAREPGNPTDPNAIRVEWRRDHLGYVPPEVAADVRERLENGERIICRASRVDPGAELPFVLTVELLRVPEPAVDSAASTQSREEPNSNTEIAPTDTQG